MRFGRSPFFQTNNNIGFRIKSFFRNPSPLNKLITINVGVYLGIVFLKIFSNLFGFLMAKESGLQIIDLISLWLSVPANISTLITKPWTLLTSIFLHLEFFHIFFNMLMLWFSGTIFLSYFKPKSLYLVYILGGMVGNILFILSYNYFPVFSSISNEAVALGASGGVLAVLIAAASKAPNQKVNLLFLGSIPLKWIALLFVVIDILSIPSGNSGGHFAHLGGALFGFFYVILPTIFLKIKPSFSFHRAKPKQTSSSQRPKTDEQYNRERAENRKKIDKILDKISKSGYQNLSKEEKELLFKSSNTKNW